MSTQVFFSGRDALLVAVPFLLLMFFALFGLSDRIGNKRANADRKPGRPGCGMDANGDPIVCDPDGKLHGSVKGPKTIQSIR